MSCAQYRLYLDGAMATAGQLARFEDITIEQEMDKATEGRFQVPLCTLPNGQWDGESEGFLKGMSRIRIEVQLQTSPWVPLLDGPIVNTEFEMFSEPGRSTLTVVVSDDSFFLHRSESVSQFKGSDDRIASQIYGEVPRIRIASTDIDSAPAPSNPGFDGTIQRGTQMELLRQLAKRQGMHAYVGPGSAPGKSVGYFKHDPSPKQDFGLSPMVLMGAGMNIFSFRTDMTVGQMATFKTGQVNLQDRSSDTRTSDLGDVAMLGSNPPPGPVIERLLKTGHVDALTLARAVQAASEKSAYALAAHGEVMKQVYGSVLQPYENVQVVGANGAISGTWLVCQVTHTLTRNDYGQTFHVKRNAQSAGTNAPAPQVPAEVH
jgi:hypothetical protein